MLSPCVSPRALNIEHILIVECVLRRLWGRVQFSAGNLLLNNRRFPLCLISYSLGTACSLLGTQIWWKRPFPNHVDIKCSEKFVPHKKVPWRHLSRSHGNRSWKSQGTNFETKSFKFRWFLGLSDQNELYHILWDDLSTRVVTISIIILELFNKENEKVLIGNIYFVLGTPSAAKFEQVPSNNTPAYLRHFVTLIW